MSFLTCWTLSCSPIIAWIFFWFVMLPLFRFFITLQSMFACLYSVFKVPAADLSAVIISSGNDRVEMVRFELMTPCLQGRCSPNWATPPRVPHTGWLWWLSGKHSLYQGMKWAEEDSNFRPHAYQACALTGWATSPCVLHKTYTTIFLVRSQEFFYRFSPSVLFFG